MPAGQLSVRTVCSVYDTMCLLLTACLSPFVHIVLSCFEMFFASLAFLLELNKWMN